MQREKYKQVKCTRQNNSITLRNRYKFGDPAEVIAGIPALGEVVGQSQERDKSEL